MVLVGNLWVLYGWALDLSQYCHYIIAYNIYFGIKIGLTSPMNC